MKAWKRPLINEDRLSNLCDGILLHILSFLATITAVRTSVLSKRWRNLWTSVPSLMFDNMEGDDSFEDEGDLCDKMLGDIVSDVLAQRQNCKLVKLELSLEARINEVILESLFHYAVQHSVQEIHLTFNDYSELVPLYRCLFKCPSLRALKLFSCCRSTVRLPASIESSALKSLQFSACSFHSLGRKAELSSKLSYPHLETLLFMDVVFLKKTYHIQAPRLGKLEFDMYGDDDVSYFYRDKAVIKFLVHAPRLTTFKISGYPPVICLLDSPFDQAIIDLDINNTYSDDSMNRRVLHTIKMLTGLHLARSITIPIEIIEVLSQFPALLDKHKSKFRNLKCLKIIMNKKGVDIELPGCVMNYFLGSSSATLKICF